MRRFIKSSEDTGNPSVRAAYGRFAGAVGIFCNMLLFSGKILAGILSGSVSITADAVNNLSDASSSIISLLGFKLSDKPADKEHPYGHGRYEYLSGLMVVVLILVIGVELFRSSLSKVLNPSPVEFGWVSIGVLIGAMLLKLWMLLLYKDIGKRIRSKTLFAAATDSRNDVITTGAVLAAALASRFFGWNLDGWMGIAVAGFIMVSGFGLIRETLDPLLGNAPDDVEAKRIRDRVMGYPGVLGTHDLLIHDYGPGRQFASVHVEMAAEEDALASHDVVDRIEQDFLEDGLHLIVHFDPIITEEGKTDDLRSWLALEVKGVYPGLTIHVRVVPGRTRKKLVFDCGVPSSLSMTDREIREAIEARVHKTCPEYDFPITVDRSFAAIP